MNSQPLAHPPGVTVVAACASALAIVALGLVIHARAARAMHPARLGGTLFEVELDSCSYGGGVVADLDGDGEREVVFGTYYQDERVIALHDDGSVLWSIPSGGGPVDNSVTVVDLDRDGQPEVLWGNSATTEFHVANAQGEDLWSRVIGEVLDAPEAIGDVNGDNQLDIVLASCGSGTGSAPGLRAFTGSTGKLLWRAAVGGCYQSAPLLFDQDGDGLLDVVVSTWFDNKLRAFSGLDGSLRWETAIGGWTYHAGSFGDLNGDGVNDVALGDYSATLWAVDGSDGTVLWSRVLPGERYVFGPTAMGDLDSDGSLEVVVAAESLRVFDAAGRSRLTIDLPGYATRGPVLSDVDGDALPDMVVATHGPSIRAYSGIDGSELFAHDFPEQAGADFHPTIADIDGDGQNDVFLVYGRGQSDTPELNWGRAVSLSLGGSDAGWPTYSHDHHHSGNYHYPAGAAVNDPPALIDDRRVLLPYLGR